MLLNTWFRSFALRLGLRRGLRGRRPAPGRTARPLAFERLEDRMLLATLTVNSLADNLIGGNGLVTLREAVAAALGDTATDLGQTGSGVDTIVFQAGLNGDIDINFGLGPIAGAIAGGQDLTIMGNGAANTQIDGQLGGRALGFVGFGGNLTLDSLTVKNGRTVLNNYSGGGVGTAGYLGTPMNLTISNSVITGNSTAGNSAEGGGVFHRANGGTLSLINSTISGNSTTGQNSQGGGVYLNGGNLIVSGTTFSNNFTTGSYANSGALHLQGNGVAIQSSYITNSSFTGNSAQNANAYAGAIGQYGNAPLGSLITIVNSTVSGNTAGAGGGGISTYNTPLLMTGTTISGNTAGAGGGGIYSATASVLITLSTISGNTAGGNGGGIDVSGVVGGTLAVYGSTITQNQAGGNAYGGGGIGANPASGVNMAIANTIVAQNFGTVNAPDFAATAGTVTVVNSLIGNNNGTGLAATGGAVGANGNIVGSAGALVDPLLGPLGNNGGPTQTHALLEGSLAINRGNNAGAAGQLADQRGAPFLRIFGGTVDIGAVEFQPLQSIVGNVATFAGTNGADRFTFNLNNRIATSIGAAYVLPGTVNSVQFDGRGGTDVFTLVGTVGAETVRLAPTQSFLDNSAPGITGQFSNFETIAHHGNGGGDNVTFTDSVLNDRFVGRSNLKRLVGTGFDNIYVGIANVVANATAGGVDTAFLFDTAGNDVFTASAATASITNTGVVTNLFETAVGFGSGGIDNAVLNGSASRDVFLGRINRASLTGGGLTFVAVGMDQVTANPAGGSDIARLFGTASVDTFTASPTTARLVGTGVQLDANNFETVVSTALGGGDVATLTDSAGDDLFVGNGNTGTMINSISNYTATGFATVTIVGVNGGNNRLALTQPLGFNLVQLGIWV